MPWPRPTLIWMELNAESIAVLPYYLPPSLTAAALSFAHPPLLPSLIFPFNPDGRGRVCEQGGSRALELEVQLIIKNWLH